MTVGLASLQQRIFNICVEYIKKYNRFPTYNSIAEILTTESEKKKVYKRQNIHPIIHVLNKKGYVYKDDHNHWQINNMESPNDCFEKFIHDSLEIIKIKNEGLISKDETIKILQKLLNKL